MTTPEGKVKARVRSILNTAPRTYYHCPVQNGMGMPSLDFIGCCAGHYFAVETKAPGKKPTERQKGTIASIEAAGGKVLVVDGDEGYVALATWLVEALMLGELER